MVRRLSTLLVAVSLLSGCGDSPGAPSAPGVLLTASLRAAPGGAGAILQADATNLGEAIHYFPSFCDSARSGIDAYFIGPAGEFRSLLSSIVQSHSCPTLAAEVASPAKVLKREIWLSGFLYEFDVRLPMSAGRWQAVVSFRYGRASEQEATRRLDLSTAFDWPPPVVASGSASARSAGSMP